MPNTSNIDRKILDTITLLRDKHHACTARAVGSHLRISADVIRHRVNILRKHNLVDWNAMPGSLRVISQQETVPESEQSYPEPAPQEESQDETPQTNDDRPLAAPKKKVAKKVGARKTLTG